MWEKFKKIIPILIAAYFTKRLNLKYEKRYYIKINYEVMVDLKKFIRKIYV